MAGIRDGGWHHLLSGSGAPKDRRKDTYDHAFVLFAMAWLYKAGGDRAAIEWAERTIGFLDHCLADPSHGGYWEELAPDGSTDRMPRRQKKPAHASAGGLPGPVRGHRRCGIGATRAEAIIELFHAHFFDAETGNALRVLYLRLATRRRAPRAPCANPGIISNGSGCCCITAG